MFREQTLLATAFYMSGYLYREKQILTAHPLRTGLLLLSVPAILAIWIQLAMDVQGWLVPVEYVIALTGTIGIILLSRALAECRISSVLTYIGDKTLYILIFHFLAFKLVSFCYLYLTHQPIDLLTSFPVLKESNGWLWLVYVISGTALPLAIWEMTHRLKPSCKKDV